MTSGSYRFGQFLLDPRDRRLKRGDDPVEMNSRYFDALALLVREQGMLVSKNRFLEEVWRGVPVTDEALTQCIKTLRRQLGDSASQPRFIETVPKHGYRFIAPVERLNETPDFGGGKDPAVPASAPSEKWHRFFQLGLAGTAGAGAAGMVGGLFYGFAGASQPLGPGMGAVSVLIVLTSLTFMIAVLGGAGVSFGIAAAEFAPNRRWHWRVLGGAFGGLIVGALVKLLGIDAFNLLFGRSPGDITGAAEGALLGAAIGLGVWLGSRRGRPSIRRGIPGALAGGAAGLLIALLGGRMMGGSLDMLARQFPDSHLRLGEIGGLLGESGFGPVTQLVTATLEGALFGGCVAGAMILARRSRDSDSLI
jgi:DNA-binding winged helix-turn-helix (wHTH) protein